MEGSLLGDANCERLRAIQPADAMQRKQLNLKDISSRFIDTVDTEVNVPTYPGLAIALFSHYIVSHAQALRDIGLELFDHLNALLAIRTNGQEDHQASPTEAFDSSPNEETMHVQNLIDSVAKRLLKFPPGNVDNTPQASDYTAHSLAAEVGLALLVLISLLCTSSSRPFLLDDTTLICVVTYTDGDDAWTTEESSQLAARLLETNLARDRLDTFITQCLLHDTLRPLFSKSSARLTASGRPSNLAHQPSSIQPRTSLDSISQERDKLRAASSFKWAVISCSQAAAGRHWPLFLPILLALAEDHNTAVRVQGLHIIGFFLDTCPANTILSAGVDSVIQDAVFPTLLFLPPTTPESEATELLYPAYQALLRIALLDPNTKSSRRRRFLDKLLRDGIFVGHFHASQHARIAEVLMNITKDIISCLGVFSAKHLQSLVRLFSTTLSDPFVMAYPPLVYATIEALNATLVNCWPRFSSPGYIDQVLHTVSLCWLNLKSSQLPTEDIDQISIRLIRTSTILQSLWSREASGPIEELAAVLQKEPRLVELFSNIIA
ncbi:hypothetical protein V8C37DRAFT_413039 [Trichoderma ceciliae]